jgi:hypothetical protein
MGKWVPKKEPEMVPVSIDTGQYRAKLAEVAQILYRYFCQLEAKSSPKSDPNASSLSNHREETTEVRR